MLKSEKPQEVERLKKLISTYSVIGILNMHKLPGRQLQKIRTALHGKAVIRMSKKALLEKALEPEHKELTKHIHDEPALIVANESPFSLFKTLKKSRSKAKARAGDIAPSDIVVLKGPTSLPPGPSISTLQNAKIKTARISCRFLGQQ